MALCYIAASDLPIQILSTTGFRRASNAWRVSKWQKNIDALVRLNHVDQDVLLLDRTERDQNLPLLIPFNAQAIESLVLILK